MNVKTSTYLHKQITPYLMESTSSSQNLIYSDTVILNIGDTDFTYSVPDGYLPWNKAWHQCTCLSQQYVHPYILFIFMLFSYI